MNSPEKVYTVDKDILTVLNEARRRAIGTESLLAMIDEWSAAKLAHAKQCGEAQLQRLFDAEDALHRVAGVDR